MSAIYSSNKPSARTPAKATPGQPKKIDRNPLPPVKQPPQEVTGPPKLVSVKVTNTPPAATTVLNNPPAKNQPVKVVRDPLPPPSGKPPEKVSGPPKVVTGRVTGIPKPKRTNAIPPELIANPPATFKYFLQSSFDPVNLQDFMKIGKEYDQNKDGKLSADESLFAGRSLRAKGQNNLSVAFITLASALEQRRLPFDQNKDGALDLGKEAVQLAGNFGGANTLEKGDFVFA